MSDLKSLGYITISTADIDRWRQFAFGVLGFAEGKGPDESALYLRMDERAARLIVVPGETDRVLTVGWEVRDRPALQRVKAALDGAGVPFKQLSRRRGRDPPGRRGDHFRGPGRHTQSRCFTARCLTTARSSPRSAREFVTGDQGLGHVVVPATDPNGLFDFYTEILGFRSRGAFRVPLPKEFGPVRVRFLGINERHHSLAIVPAAHQRDPRLVHIMVEVDTLDAVGRALDRINAEGFQLSSTLGRHTNDKMISFYVRAPGDWDIEFGTDGMRVDETYYTAEEITADSYWGHQWVGEMPAAMRL